MKILVVDDVVAKVKEIAKIAMPFTITENGFDHASTVSEAKKRLQNSQYDIMIVDLNLPIDHTEDADPLSGIRLVEDIKNSRTYKTPTHIIGCTEFEEYYIQYKDQFEKNGHLLTLLDRSSDSWENIMRNHLQHVADRLAQPIKQAYGLDVCFIAALQKEEDAVRDLEIDWHENRVIDQYLDISLGTFESKGVKYSVGRTRANRMGMVEASIITNKVIHAMRPRMIVMTGICAGVTGKAELGDVILASPAWDWQSGKQNSDADRKWFTISPHQIEVDMSIARNFSNTFSDGLLMRKIQDSRSFNPRLRTSAHVGPVATGSAVLADSSTVDHIKQQHRNLLGIEMEIYGVYAACLYASVPKPLFFAVKGVCDLADDQKDDNVQDYAAYASAQATFSFLKLHIAALLQ